MLGTLREGVLKDGGAARVIWLSTGLNDEVASEFAAALSELGAVTVLANLPSALPNILLPPVSERDGLIIRALKAPGSVVRNLNILVRGNDGGVLTVPP